MTEPVQETRRMHVLFVDDEKIVLECIKRMLCTICQDWDMEFESDVLVAAERLLTETYDAVVTDANMPGMSGYELLEQVEKAQPWSARIVLSGGLDRESEKMAVLHRFRLIEKPCDYDTLRYTIAAAIDESCAGQAARGTANTFE